jgi:hypothetical protein
MKGSLMASAAPFVVYLASHNRPVHEVLFPSLRDIRQEFEHNFAGMTADPVDLDELLAARERMTRELQQGLNADERRFLLSLVAAEPDWTLLGLPHLTQLPGPRWKLQTWQAVGLVLGMASVTLGRIPVQSLPAVLVLGFAVAPVRI